MKEEMKFKPLEDGMDPNRIPRKRMGNGVEIPVVGMGTFGSDHVTPQQVAKAVVDAACLGQRAFDHEEYMGTWVQMEQLLEMGLVRAIGTSNMTIPKMNLLLRDCQIKPAVNEMECHPHFQQPELFDYLVAHDIQPIGFCPLGSPGRPERDRAPGDTVDMEDPVILRIAKAHGIHPAAVCLKWAIQRGLVVIPFSTRRRNYRANLFCATTPPLTDEEMSEIAGIDRNCRLIKGQVFTWEGSRGWEDLWDLDGTIAK